MSRRYFTADWHMCHTSVLEYCGRPFKDLEHMHAAIIHEANMRAREDDTIVHVGDLLLGGRVRGVEGPRIKAWDFVKQINATMVLVTGNHDRTNHVKTVCEYMFVDIGPQRAFVTHYPTAAAHFPPALRDFVKATCNFVICGHVHEKWLYHWDNGILNVNVGVDQHKFRPISDDELLVLVHKIRRQKV